MLSNQYFFIMVNAMLQLILRLMNDILRNFRDAAVIAYLDDIVIFDASWEEHLIHLKQDL